MAMRRGPRDRSGDWTALSSSICKRPAQPAAPLLLIDARHGLRSSDRAIMKLLDEAAVSYQIVLTKADKVKPDGAARPLRRTVAGELARHAAAHPEIIVTSATDRRRHRRAARRAGAALSRPHPFAIESAPMTQGRNFTDTKHWLRTARTLAEALPYMQRYAGQDLRHQIRRPCHGR